MPSHALPSTTSAMCNKVAAQDVVVRREATCGIAADNLLTAPRLDQEGTGRTIRGAGRRGWVPADPRAYRASLNGGTATPQAKSLRRKGSTMERLVTPLGEAL
jgi:hypothetical protein